MSHCYYVCWLLKKANVLVVLFYLYFFFEVYTRAVAQQYQHPFINGSFMRLFFFCISNCCVPNTIVWCLQCTRIICTSSQSHYESGNTLNDLTLTTLNEIEETTGKWGRDGWWNGPRPCEMLNVNMSRQTHSPIWWCDAMKTDHL